MSEELRPEQTPSSMPLDIKVLFAYKRVLLGFEDLQCTNRVICEYRLHIKKDIKESESEKERKSMIEDVIEVFTLS